MSTRIEPGRAGPSSCATGIVLVALTVAALTSRVAAQTPFYVPDVPPRAGLIQLSAPDAAGDVSVVGSPGAVPANAMVALVNMDTGHVALAEATADGNFTASVFAPPGTSILVKADPNGLAIQQLAQELATRARASYRALAPVPGTILRVPDPPATAGIPFGVAARSDPGGLGLPFTFQGTVNAQALAPGDTLRVQGTLLIASAALENAGAIRANLRLALERLAGPDGSPGLARNAWVSVFPTPTGLPIERLPSSNVGLTAGASVDLIRPTPDQAAGAIDIALPLPVALPDGFYRPTFEARFEGIPEEFFPSRPTVHVGNQRRSGFSEYLPIIRVGTPATPRLLWMLLSDVLSEGSRGVRAVEDRGRVGLTAHIATQSETFIVPRLDRRSGQPLVYRLEPFAPIVSTGEPNDSPNLPLIPFRFPSGHLTVRVRKPDGTVDVIGPAPFAQARLVAPAHGDNTPLDAGPHAAELYQLSTMDPRFEVVFLQDGLHVITLEGAIEDVWGNTWVGSGIYEVHLARAVALDTAVLPGTPFEVEDVLALGLSLSPPVAADVEVRFRLAPGSDPSRMVERTVRGRANRFGYYHPLRGGIPLDQAGEYRVDVTVSFRDEQGGLWMGTRTWGGVVAPRDGTLVAHGRRGITGEAQIGHQWFFRSQTEFPSPGACGCADHVFFPFHSGDVQWAQRNDSALAIITAQVLDETQAAFLRQRYLSGANSVAFDGFAGFLPGGYDERAAVGETPLVSTRPDQLDAHIDPAGVDLWGYGYRSVQRPLVRVREIVAEDSILKTYWGFGGEYFGQIGAGRSGDLPNDIKFQYGAAVLRGPAVGQPQYAVYGSLFVLIPENDARGGSRTFPPFQGNGGGPSGGPLLTLKGRDIDLFLHLTGVRPGTVLEVGDAFGLSGAVGPPLPAVVSYTVTTPSGQRVSFSGRANRVGYYYRPDHDFLVEEPGLYTVDLQVTYDGLTSAGQVTPPFPTGDVLGTAGGRFFVYVVTGDSAPLVVDLPRTVFLPPPAQLDVSASLLTGLTPSRAHVTTMMPGFVLETRDLAASGSLAYRYDPLVLGPDFPNLDVDSGDSSGGDAITITLFAAGTAANGGPAHAARIVVLHGTELINLPVPSSLGPPSPRFTLSVTQAGTGNGTVTSAPSGITCGEICTATYASGTLVTLTAAAAENSHFAGFGGPEDCAGGRILMTADTTCAARFSPLPAIVSPADGTQFPLDTPTTITVSWLGIPGATAYFFEFTGPNQSFVTQNGSAPDPNGAAGSGGGTVVVGTRLTAVLDPSFPSGTYEVRVIGVSAAGQPVGSFSDPLTLVLGIVRNARPTITLPPTGTHLTRGTPVTFAWTRVAGAARYLVEVTESNRPFVNPNGIAPDPGALARVVVVEPGFSTAVPRDLPVGVYQLRVIALSPAGAPGGVFSDALTVVVE